VDTVARHEQIGLDTTDGPRRGDGRKGPPPVIHLERAALARSLGDGASRERELREAHRLFTDIGAPIRAEQVLRQLERR